MITTKELPSESLLIIANEHTHVNHVSKWSRKCSYVLLIMSENVNRSGWNHAYNLVTENIVDRKEDEESQALQAGMHTALERFQGSKESLELHNLDDCEPIALREAAHAIVDVTICMALECRRLHLLASPSTVQCGDQGTLKTLHRIEHPFLSSCRKEMTVRSELFAELVAESKRVAFRTAVIDTLDTSRVECATVSRGALAVIPFRKSVWNGTNRNRGENGGNCEEKGGGERQETHCGRFLEMYGSFSHLYISLR